MKLLIKRVVSFLVANDYFWALIDTTILRVARYADRERRRNQVSKRQSVIDAAVLTVCPDMTVRHGPFNGMKYPEYKSVGSSLFPKLIGSYEREIQPIIEAICECNYSDIVDIGCAEGYYAVGLAMRIPSARIFAYDTNVEAIRLCRKMAELNNVSQRIITGAFCDSDKLKSLPFSGRGLVISDCEGYEKDLFTMDLVQVLVNHDVLIEVHDFVDPHISSLIRKRFEKTHNIRTIQSISDKTKARTYLYEELHNYDLATRQTLFAELRHENLEWLYMTPCVK
jgi:hypothetical protein